MSLITFLCPMVPLLLLLAPNKEEVRLRRIWRPGIVSISRPIVSTVVVILLIIKSFTYKNIDQA
jgi:hypothetical protein